MSQCVPDTIPVHLRSLPIAIWCSHFTPGSFPARHAEPKRFEVGFAPAGGAYVACIRIADGASSLTVSAWQLRCGRCNDFGWVLKRARDALGEESSMPRSGWKKKGLPPGGVKDPDAILPDGGLADYDDDTTDAMDAGVPLPRDLGTFGPDDAAMLELDSSDANAEALAVLPNEQYRIFWTYDHKLFLGFLGAYDKDPQDAVETYEVPLYRVGPYRPQLPVWQLRGFSPREQAFVARVVPRSKRDAVGEGYHGGWPCVDGMAAAIFDGTPRTLRTLYLCEWLDWCCQNFPYSDPHWPALLALRGAIRAAQAGAPIPDLAKMLPHLEVEEVEGPREDQIRARPVRGVGPDPELAKAQAVHAMRHYLHQLAEAGTNDRRSASDLVDVWGEAKPFAAPWREVADAMRRRYGIPHPAEDWSSYDPFRFSDEERGALVGYFDMYSLGFSHAADASPLDAHWNDVQRALGKLRDRQTAWLQTLTHPQLMRSLGLHVPRGQRRYKVELASRYHALCANLGLAFWEPAHAALSLPGAWDAHKPFVSWMAETSGLLGEVFDDFLKKYAKRYRGLFSESVEKMVQYLFRYYRNLRPDEKTVTLPTHQVVVRIEPDAASGRVIAKVFRGDKATKLLELELLTSVTTAPEGEVHAPVGRRDPRTSFKRYRRSLARGEVRMFKARPQTLWGPDEDAPGLSGFPKALAGTAAALKTGMAAAALIDELLEQDLAEADARVALDFAQESLQAMEVVLGPLLERLSGQGSKATRLLLNACERAGKAGLMLESIRNFGSGAMTLSTFFTGDGAGTDLARYLDRGQALPAFLETTKGLVQVATGAAGMGAAMAGGDATLALVLGTSTTLATVPLSAWVAVGLVTVAMLDVVIYVDTGGGSPVDEFLNAVREARKAQFILASTPETSSGDRIISRQEEVKANGSQGQGSRQATCLLTRKVNAVNQLFELVDIAKA